ncbi:MAG: response regulator transcription factor [Anaerolineales bacterium]|nr:response regulator transcription factor [Anaerolineales bacterium]
MIRVLLVDDHTIFREGLRALLDHYDDIQVIGEAQDGEEAIVNVRKLQPDIVIMDIAMSGMGGIEATRLIHRQHPDVKVLVLTQHGDWRYIEPLLQAGASGYVTKRTLGKDLISALHAVAHGETFLGPDVSSTVAEHIRSQAKPSEPVAEALTPREKEILEYIALGNTNSQIAVILSISVKTVEWHRTNLMNKLDAHCVADLIRYAFQRGLVDENL